jgi:hypothetical protein
VGRAQGQVAAGGRGVRHVKQLVAKRSPATAGSSEFGSVKVRTGDQPHTQPVQQMQPVQAQAQQAQQRHVRRFGKVQPEI